MIANLQSVDDKRVSDYQNKIFYTPLHCAHLPRYSHDQATDV